MITAAHKTLCPCDTSANLSPKIVPPKVSVNLPISQSTLQVGNLFLACISHTSLKSLSTRYDVCRRRRILGRCMCSGSPAIDHLPSLQEIRSVKDKPFYCQSSVGDNCVTPQSQGQAFLQPLMAFLQPLLCRSRHMRPFITKIFGVTKAPSVSYLTAQSTLCATKIRFFQDQTSNWMARASGRIVKMRNKRIATHAAIPGISHCSH